MAGRILKAGKEARELIQKWKAANPRNSGETLTQYRRRAKEEIEKDLRLRYAGDINWIEIILAILKILLPLLIV